MVVDKILNGSPMGIPDHSIPPNTPVSLLSHLSTLASSESSTKRPLRFADRLYSSLRLILETMTGTNNDTCISNCSGRGECLEGTCFCQVQYHGASCTDPNLAYFVSFASIFYLIAFVSFTQLLICVRSEYLRMKTPSLRKACVITTQKMLYMITCLAAVLRGAYFSSPSNADLPLSASFMSAYYLTILTSGSLIVCFWAEGTSQSHPLAETKSPPWLYGTDFVDLLFYGYCTIYNEQLLMYSSAFHLRDIKCDRPRFLGKSFVGFIAFNFITYSLFITEIILTKTTQTEDERAFLTHIFNGCYAVLLFIVVVFFLIYGVEVYFKVRGGFVSDTVIVGNVHSRSPSSSSPQSPLLSDQLSKGETNCPSSSNQVPQRTAEALSKEEKETESSEHLIKKRKMKGAFVEMIPQLGIDHSQLHQSRFGLVFQACMLMITVCFLCSDVLGGFWKNKVPLMSRNAYDIIFRVVDLAVALWFPCVLWNCISPEQLWILNPKKILKKLDFEKTLEFENSFGSKAEANAKSEVTGECWICYDSDALSSGPMIQPCDCKGDVSVVHHNCLRKWLMESAPNDSSECLSCKVCGAPYQLERKNIWWIGNGFTAKQWLQTASLVTVMCATISGFWAAMQLCEDAYQKALAAGGALIVFYICLRLLGFNFLTGYRRAKISAVKILGGKFASSVSAPVVATIMPIEGHHENSFQHKTSHSLNVNLPETDI